MMSIKQKFVHAIILIVFFVALLGGSYVYYQSNAMPNPPGDMTMVRPDFDADGGEELASDVAGETEEGVLSEGMPPERHEEGGIDWTRGLLTLGKNVGIIALLIVVVVIWQRVSRWLTRRMRKTPLDEVAAHS